jgi:predicted nuclease of predicted toxin-antitoxin system
MRDMKFLVDAQLPPALAEFIVAQGFESLPVRAVGLRDAEDDAIWKFAEDGEWVVVTKDEDFVERALIRDSGPQIVWLRIGNCTNRGLIAWLSPIFMSIPPELEAGSRIVEVKLEHR